MNRFHEQTHPGAAAPLSRTDPLLLPVESLPDVALFLLDPSGRAIRWNRRGVGRAPVRIGGIGCRVVSRAGSGRPESDPAGAPAGEGRGAPAPAPRGRSARQDTHRAGTTEADPRRAAELLRAIADSTTDAVFVKDRDGRYLLANPATARFVGRPAADIIGRTDDELFAPESARWVRDRDRRVMASGRAETEEEFLTADGVTRTFLATKAPYRDADGNVVGLIGISRDITDRKRAERELALFRALIDRTTDVIEVIDPETGRFMDVNEEACLAHGYTRAEYLGLRLADVDPLVAARPWSDVVGAARRAKTLPFESRHVRKDGTTFPVEVRVNWVRADREYMVAVVRDVTERKRNEAALRETQERLRSVISSSPAVLYTLALGPDRVWHIAWASENVRGMLGFAPEEVIDPAWWGAQVHPDDRARAAAVPPADAARSATAEYRIRHRNGEFRWVRSEIRLVCDAAGEPVEVVGSWADVTERKLIEDQYRQAQKMEAFGQLAGGVAHDFNNILTVINGYSALLLARSPPGDDRRDALTEIRAAGQRAAALTAQLLAFSRKTIVEPKVLDLNAVVDALAKFLRRLIGEDVALVTALAPALGRVKADQGQIEQVIVNLVVNARDAMPRGGRLTVETANAVVGRDDAARDPGCRPGAYVRLSVTDTGTGMTEEVKARLFEPYFTTKGPGKGTGLGLATVYGIVTQAGGRLRVTSAIGRGTTFTILLPATTEPFADDGGAAAAAAGGTETVLLVEDEESVRTLTRIVLEERGYVVLEAGGGAAAVGIAAAHPGPIHLLVTDVVMPGMSGREVAAGVQRLRPEVRVLYMSGYTDDAVVRHGVTEERGVFLRKPFTPHELAQIVRARLGDAARGAGGG